MNQEQIEKDYQEALRRIRYAKETRTLSLDLSGLVWDRIPLELFELTWLEDLNLQAAREPRKVVGNNPVLPEQFACLNQLRVLNINRLGLQSLAPLPGLTQLTTLDCRFNKLTDLGPIAGLNQLTSLDCEGNRLTNLGPLAQLTQLTTLTCGYNPLNNLDPLVQLTQLTILDCQSNRLTDLSPLAGLTQLTTLGCSSNQLTDLTPLAELTQLTTLCCGGNQLANLAPLSALTNLTFLECPVNRLTDLAPLTGLTQLTTLRCGWNPLNDLIPLTDLTQLKSLNCQNNQLTDLIPLGSLTKLTTLDCRGNRLTDLSPLASLTQLTTLHCEYNRLTDLSVIRPFVLNGQLEKLSVFENPVSGIPQEILGASKSESENVAKALQSYWLDLEQGSEPNRDVKVLLVGNGCVGKSTLAHGLRTGAAPPIPISERTHAIEIELLEVPLSSDGPVLRWHLWDFGGQEMYHATHRLFLHQQAVFLLLWAEETDEAPDEVRHPVSYWLSFVQDLSSDSPVFLIKNQIDRQDLLPRPPDLPEGSSPFIQELKVSALRYQGVDTLKGAVMDYLKHHPERWAYDLPSSWLRLRKDLENRRPYKVLPRAHFAQLCLTHEVRHPDTVLKYLHESGFLFYRKGAFQDQIILDQNWMINLIYRLFDPRQGVRDALARQDGQFSGKDTQRFWPDHAEGDRQVIVNFLTGSRMAFVLDHIPVGIIPFEQQQFVLPALLPTEPPLGVQIWGGPQPEEWWVDCSYAFLHRGLIEAIIVRTAQLSPHREWWRDGVIFSDEKAGCQVLARYAPEAGLPSTIRFRLRGTGKAETLAKVRRLLEELHPHRQPEMWVSMDGIQFVSASTLEQARQQGKTQVVSRAQDIVEVQPYQMFLQMPKLADNKNVFPDLAAYPRRIRIFISYAHIDENPYKERLKVTIKNLARRFPIDVWDDRQLFAGHPWEPEILKKLDQADIVCLLISPDFIASDYCFSKEMKKALAKYEQGRGIPIPILIRATSDWEQFPIGRHQALPTPAKPLAQWQDPDEFWASVQHGLRQQIERLLNQNSFP